MSLSTARLVASLPVSMASVARAARFAQPGGRGLYRDDAQRRAFRGLLDAAALTGSQVRLAFVKNDGTLRYMQAIPCLGVDATYRYYTVMDVDLLAEKGREVFRRVSLDTIARVDVVFQA